MIRREGLYCNKTPYRVRETKTRVSRVARHRIDGTKDGFRETNRCRRSLGRRDRREGIFRPAADDFPKTASQFGALGLQFFVASPVFDVDKGTDKDFHFMKKIRYLLDLRKSWTHRLLMLGKPITGPYPEGIVPPWLRSC